MEYLLFLARQPAVAFKLPSFLCHWRVYYCSNLLLIFTPLSLIIEGQAGFITPEAVTGFLQCLPPAGVFALEILSLHLPRWPKIVLIQSPGAWIFLVTHRTGQSIPAEIFPWPVQKNSGHCKPWGSQIRLVCSSGMEHRGFVWGTGS